MKSFTVIGVVILAMLGLSGSFASTATARCAVIKELGTGLYGDNGCTQNNAGGEYYILVEPGGNPDGWRVECAQVTNYPLEKGPYTNQVCASKVGAEKRWIRVGVAGAGFTDLCSTHEDPCEEENHLSSLHTELTSGSILLLNSSGTDILCLSALAQASVGALDLPQPLEFTSVKFSNCGTEGAGGSHSNCTITSGESSIHAEVMTTGLNKGELHISDGEISMKCTIFGFIKVECSYGTEELLFGMEGATEKSNGMVNLASTPIEQVTGGSLCPEELEISSGLLEPKTAVYLSS